jgi:uncharacterized protein YdeI (YjbR/CyaY-like superfamily)
MSGQGSARYFSSPAAFRAWLQKNHGRAKELLVGFHKAHTGRPTMTWSQSVDEALCFGWIDGVRRGVDAERYTIRFTPRKPTSIWSAINIAKVEALEAAGKMTDAGRAAFAKRAQGHVGVYAHENRPHELPPEFRERMDSNPTAAAHFDSRAPSYRRSAVWWVISAKQQTTRERRIAALVGFHAKGELLPQFRPLKRQKHAVA